MTFQPPASVLYTKSISGSIIGSHKLPTSNDLLIFDLLESLYQAPSSYEQSNLFINRRLSLVAPYVSAETLDFPHIILEADSGISLDTYLKNASVSVLAYTAIPQLTDNI